MKDGEVFLPIIIGLAGVAVSRAKPAAIGTPVPTSASLRDGRSTVIVVSQGLSIFWVGHVGASGSVYLMISLVIRSGMHVVKCHVFLLDGYSRCIDWLFSDG